MSWNEVNSQQAAGGTDPKSLFLKLTDGSNSVRIVSEPEVHRVHWVQVSGKAEGVGCPGSMICPLCSMGEPAQERHMFVVISRATGEVKLLDAPKTVGISLKSLFLNPNWGELSRYDVTITKEGSQNFTRYSVVPNPIADMLPQERQAVADFLRTVNIKEYVTPDSPEEIRNIIEGRGRTPKQPPQRTPQQYPPQPHFVTGLSIASPQPQQPQAQPQYAPPAQFQPQQQPYIPNQPIQYGPVVPSQTAQPVQPVVVQPQPQVQQPQPMQPFQTSKQVYTQTDAEIFGPQPNNPQQPPRR